LASGRDLGNVLRPESGPLFGLKVFKSFNFFITYINIKTANACSNVSLVQTAVLAVMKWRFGAFFDENRHLSTKPDFSVKPKWLMNFFLQNVSSHFDLTEKFVTYKKLFLPDIKRLEVFVPV
jgi:hypothetical protein